jgi:hypothetical protein
MIMQDGDELDQRQVEFEVAEEPGKTSFVTFLIPGSTHAAERVSGREEEI